MRLLACTLLVVGIAACQHADSAERLPAHETVSRAEPKATAPAVSAVAPPAQQASCGGACGGAGQCSGACGDSCGGAGEAPQWAAIGADATWQPVYVEGMRCGGCAKRIERALANVDGVLAVKTDFRTKKIEIVTKPGIDARQLVKPAIDGLGYRVQ